MTNTISFTIKKLDSLPVPERGKRDEYKDKKCEYLRLRITSQGTKSFSVYKRIKGSGKVARVSVGKYPALLPEEARRQARLIIADTELGVNPNEVKKTERIQKISLREAFEVYLEEKKLRSTTEKGYISAFDCHLVNLQHVELKKITRPMVLEAFKSIKSPGQANLAMRLMRAIYNFAREEYINQDGTPIFLDNPVNILSHRKAWHILEARNTHIRDIELNNFAKSLSEVRKNEPGNAAAITDALLFGLLTGLRKNEILGLKWENIDIESRFIFIPSSNTKNKTSLEWPLTPYLLQILSWQKVSESPYIFAGSHVSGQLKEPKKVVQKIMGLCGSDCQFHDLRRTFATIAEQLDISLYKRKRLMNHKTLRDDVTAGYTVMNCEILREAAEKIQNDIVDKVGWFPAYPSVRF